MTKLWRAIEESPLLMDVKDVWRERLGMEFEPLSRFLEATNIVATRLPDRTPWSSFKVVVNGDSFVAFCESTGESKEVPRADVICHQLNSRQLATELNAALSLGRKPEWLDNSRRVWFLGNLSLELQSRPVYMSLHIASDLITEALHAAAAHARSTFLLLDLNSKRRDQKLDASAKIVDCKRLGCHPLIFLPYLSPERLAELESMAVSGIDLCGNGIVYVPNRICVVRTGQLNLYPDSRPVANPFRGRSGLVARMLIEKPHWETLSELTEAIEKHAQLKGPSLSQVSQTISAYAEELLVLKDGNTIRLADPIRMLDQLGKNWRLNPSGRSRFYRSSKGPLKLSGLSNSTKLAWSLTGETSATRYYTIAQGGPMKVAVSDLKLAESLLSLTPESVPSFADIVLIESHDDAAFFANEQDEDGVRYASRIQTWIELNAGDARQRETAKDLYQSIIKASKA